MEKLWKWQMVTRLKHHLWGLLKESGTVVFLSVNNILKHQWILYLIFLGFVCLCPQTELKETDKENMKMTCSSKSCSLPKLTHPRCFTKLESSAVVAMRNVRGRTREWSDKERLRVGFIFISSCYWVQFYYWLFEKQILFPK